MKQRHRSSSITERDSASTSSIQEVLVRSVNDETTILLSGLAERNALHLTRKLFHLTFGSSMIALYHFVLSRIQMIQLLILFFFILFGGEMLRFYSITFNRLMMKYWGKIMRKNEASQFSGMIYYVPGMLLVIALYPPMIAKLSMFYLAAGDPFAALAGTLAKDFLRIPRHGKSLVGAAANFVLSAVVTTVVIHYYLLQLGSIAHCCHFGSADLLTKSITLGLIGGFASTLSEMTVHTPRPRGFDDNFAVPVLSAFILFIAIRYLECSCILRF